MSDVATRLATALAGRYAIERELGHGGMATVHLARDVKHGRTVAIKVLRPELAQAVGAERFLREINIAAQLQSPHILNPARPGERLRVDALLVDTGSELTWVPTPLLESLGIERVKRLRFRQASGQIVGRWTGGATVFAARRRSTTQTKMPPPSIMIESTTGSTMADFTPGSTTDVAASSASFGTSVLRPRLPVSCTIFDSVTTPSTAGQEELRPA